MVPNKLESNWNVYYSQHFYTKWTPFSDYPLPILLPAAGDVIIEMQVTDLAEHTSRALNCTL